MASDNGPRPETLPKHTAQNNRALRENYRRLQQDVTQNKEQMADLKGNKLHSFLNDANLLHLQAEKPKEHAMDAHLFELLTEAGLEASKKLDLGVSGPSIVDFIRALKIRYILDYQPEDEDPEQLDYWRWVDMDERAGKFIKLAPGMNCMLGPMAAEAKVRAVRRQTQRKEDAPLVRPEELGQHATEADKQDTDKNMEEMYEVLQGVGGEGVPFVNLVMNTQSFGQTVENIFTLSFLVRDHRVQYYPHPDDNSLCVKVIDRKALKKAKQAAAGEKRHREGAATSAGADQQAQFIMKLTMEDWDIMRRATPTEECLMRHRPPQAH